MGWVDRLNQWALKQIRRQAIERVETDREGSTLIRADGRQFIRWSDVQEIAVLKQPPLARGSFALAIRGPGSTVAVVDDTVAGYAELCRELPRRLTGVTPYQKWAVELTASSQDTGKVIFRRTAS
jgi:hypothetical protein